MARNHSDAYLNATSLISEFSTIKGDVECGGDMRIDGSVIGNITCKGKLVIGVHSKITGNIDAHILDIGGHVSGDVKIMSSLILRAKSNLSGNIDLISASLEIEESAIFNGKCSMVSE